MMKSVEELDWLRIGAHLSDRGMMALRDNLKPGVNERELGNCHRARLCRRRRHRRHSFHRRHARCTIRTSRCRAQFPSTRKIQRGDVVFAEISAAFWDYSGQVLRSFAVGEPPTPLYRALHAAADAAFDAIVAVLKDGTTSRGCCRGVARD